MNKPGAGMVIGFRFLAFVVDCPLCFFSIFAMVHVTGWLVEKSGGLGIFLIPLWFALFMAWPFLYFGVPTGLWGKTPGKFLCRLEVSYADGRRPGLCRGLGREALKLLSIACMFGAIICIFQILYQGATWYDHICGTDVNFRPYVRLTGTQKRFRQYMKEQERAEMTDVEGEDNG